MMITYNIFNPDVTFLTANERSLNRCRLIIGRRWKHRLSFAERERRIDFVRNKHIVQLLNKVMLRKSGDISELKDLSFVAYNRGRIRVNNLALASASYAKLPELHDFKENFEIFWKFNVQMRRLQMVMKAYRKFFGPDCFESGRMELGKEGWAQLAARLHFRGHLESLSKARQFFCRNYWDPDIIRAFTCNNPAWDHVCNNFNQILELRDWLRLHRGLLDFKDQTMERFESFSHMVPNFDSNLLIDTRLTPKLQAQMVGRKVKMLNVMRWYLLFEKPVIKRQYHFSSNVSLCSALSLTTVASWVPYCKVVLRDGLNLPPLFKFSAPQQVQNWQHICIPSNRMFRPSDLVGRVYSDYEKRFKRDKWLRTTAVFANKPYPTVRPSAVPFNILTDAFKDSLNLK